MATSTPVLSIKDPPCPEDFVRVIEHRLQTMSSRLTDSWTEPAESLINFIDHRSRLSLKYSTLIPVEILKSARAAVGFEAALAAASKRCKATLDLIYDERPLLSEQMMRDKDDEATPEESAFIAVERSFRACILQVDALFRGVFLNPQTLDFSFQGYEEVRLCVAAGGSGSYTLLDLPRKKVQLMENFEYSLNKLLSKCMKIANELSEPPTLHQAKANLETRLAETAKSHALEVENLKDIIRNLNTELIAAKAYVGLPPQWDSRQFTGQPSGHDHGDDGAEFTDIVNAYATSSSVEPSADLARQRRNNAGPMTRPTHGPGSIAITIAQSTRASVPPDSSFWTAASATLRHYLYTKDERQRFRFCYILILAGAAVVTITLTVGFLAHDGWAIAAVLIAIGGLLLILLARGHYAHCRCWKFAA